MGDNVQVEVPHDQAHERPGLEAESWYLWKRRCVNLHEVTQEASMGRRVLWGAQTRALQRWPVREGPGGQRSKCIRKGRPAVEC